MTISNTTSTAALASTQVPAQPRKVSGQEPQDSTGSNGAVDQVKLSPSMQARLMKSGGQGVSEIAANMGLSVKAVEQYLGLNIAAEQSLLAAAK